MQRVCRTPASPLGHLRKGETGRRRTRSAASGPLCLLPSQRAPTGRTGMWFRRTGQALWCPDRDQRSIPAACRVGRYFRSVEKGVPIRAGPGNATRVSPARARRCPADRWVQAPRKASARPGGGEAPAGGGAGAGRGLWPPAGPDIGVALWQGRRPLQLKRGQCLRPSGREPEAHRVSPVRAGRLYHGPCPPGAPKDGIRLGAGRACGICSAGPVRLTRPASRTGPQAWSLAA